MKRFRSTLIAICLALFANLGHATLVGRDLNGDQIADALFDSEQNLTWFRNANVNNGMNWVDAKNWAAGFEFSGYQDWRLPSISEMQSLWTVNGRFGGLSGTFTNLQQNLYWSGTDVFTVPGVDTALMFGVDLGYTFIQFQSAGNYAMAVTNGDVGRPLNEVPEPTSVALTLLALFFLLCAREHSRSV
jgi:hypothetical protein